MAVKDIIKDKMGLPDIANSHILTICQFHLLFSLDSSNMSPISIIFCSQEVEKSIFLAKSNLAKTGVSVSKYLTRKRIQLLDLACNKLGSKNKWSIEEKIFVKQGPNTRKI
jgi:hypothetical protein